MATIVEAVPNNNINKYLLHRIFHILNQKLPKEQIDFIKDIVERYQSNTYVFEPNIKEINHHPFRIMPFIKKITIPNTVRFIKFEAFMNCCLLEEIHIPISVVSISSYAFYNCLRLKTIVIPKYVSEIHKETFGYCMSLEYVDISSVKYINEYAFRECKAIKQCFINDDLLCEYTAFEDCVKDKLIKDLCWYPSITKIIDNYQK